MRPRGLGLSLVDAGATRNNVVELEAGRRSLELVEAPVDVWLASGLRCEYRVVSETVTFGEWDDAEKALRFLELLVAGNPQLRRLV